MVMIVTGAVLTGCGPPGPRGGDGDQQDRVVGTGSGENYDRGGLTEQEKARSQGQDSETNAVPDLGTTAGGASGTRSGTGARGK